MRQPPGTAQRRPPLRVISRTQGEPMPRHVLAPILWA